MWRAALGGLVVSCSACSCAGRVPLPDQYRVAGAPELIERMRGAQSTVKSFVGEARLTYFGPEGRVRGTASIAVVRPHSLRYEVQGPTGVLEAFATNGNEFQVLNMAQTHFVHGPATAENLDRLITFAPLNLDAAGWVSLLFGEVPVPPSAALRYDDRTGHFVLTWERGGQALSVSVAPASARVVRAEVRAGERLLTRVKVEDRDERGLVEELFIEAPTAQVELEVHLRDVVADPETLEPDDFILDPPAGFGIERL